MTKVLLPYGKKKLEAEIEDECLKGILLSHLDGYIPEKTEIELVEDALNEPIDSLPLSQLAKDKNKIVIICSDHTRPVPSKIIIPLMLKEIRKGNPHADITLLVATGAHRESTKEELIGKFGEDIVNNERIVIHNAKEDEMIDLGRLPSGGKLLVNKLAIEADLLCSEGFIEPHFFAGFSGGRKSILPGVASLKTVMANHCSKFIDSERSRTGIIDGNPIHEDMLFAAKAAKLAFICNVVINADKKVVYAVAGDVDKAHRQGVAFLSKYCMVDSLNTDIVITSNGGYPLDQNIYQSVKGMSSAEAAVKKGGVIIMCASALDGHGGDAFYDTFKSSKSLEELYKEFMARDSEHTITDQWQSQIFARILMRATIIYVSEMDDEMVRDFRMIPAKSLKDAIDMAKEITGKNSSISVIPDGVSVIVKNRG